MERGLLVVKGGHRYDPTFSCIAHSPKKNHYALLELENGTITKRTLYDESQRTQLERLLSNASNVFADMRTDEHLLPFTFPKHAMEIDTMVFRRAKGDDELMSLDAMTKILKTVRHEPLFRGTSDDNFKHAFSQFDTEEFTVKQHGMKDVAGRTIELTVVEPHTDDWNERMERVYKGCDAVASKLRVGASEKNLSQLFSSHMHSSKDRVYGKILHHTGYERWEPMDIEDVQMYDVVTLCPVVGDAKGNMIPYMHSVHCMKDTFRGAGEERVFVCSAFDKLIFDDIRERYDTPEICVSLHTHNSLTYLIHKDGHIRFVTSQERKDKQGNEHYFQDNLNSERLRADVETTFGWRVYEHSTTELRILEKLYKLLNQILPYSVVHPKDAYAIDFPRRHLVSDQGIHVLEILQSYNSDVEPTSPERFVSWIRVMTKGDSKQEQLVKEAEKLTYDPLQLDIHAWKKVWDKKEPDLSTEFLQLLFSNLIIPSATEDVINYIVAVGNSGDVESCIDHMIHFYELSGDAQKAHAKEHFKPFDHIYHDGDRADHWICFMHDDLAKVLSVSPQKTCAWFDQKNMCYGSQNVLHIPDNATVQNERNTYVYWFSYHDMPYQARISKFKSSQLLHLLISYDDEVLNLEHRTRLLFFMCMDQKQFNDFAQAKGQPRRELLHFYELQKKLPILYLHVLITFSEKERNRDYMLQFVNDYGNVTSELLGILYDDDPTFHKFLHDLTSTRLVRLDDDAFDEFPFTREYVQKCIRIYKHATVDLFKDELSPETFSSSSFEVTPRLKRSLRNETMIPRLMKWELKALEDVFPRLDPLDATLQKHLVTDSMQRVDTLTAQCPYDDVSPQQWAIEHWNEFDRVQNVILQMLSVDHANANVAGPYEGPPPIPTDKQKFLEKCKQQFSKHNEPLSEDTWRNYEVEFVRKIRKLGNATVPSFMVITVKTTWDAFETIQNNLDLVGQYLYGTHTHYIQSALPLPCSKKTRRRTQITQFPVRQYPEGVYITCTQNVIGKIIFKNETIFDSVTIRHVYNSAGSGDVQGRSQFKVYDKQKRMCAEIHLDFYDFTSEEVVDRIIVHLKMTIRDHSLESPALRNIIQQWAYERFVTNTHVLVLDKGYPWLSTHDDNKYVMHDSPQRALNLSFQVPLSKHLAKFDRDIRGFNTIEHTFRELWKYDKRCRTPKVDNTLFSYRLVPDSPTARDDLFGMIALPDQPTNVQTHFLVDDANVFLGYITHSAEFNRPLGSNVAHIHHVEIVDKAKEKENELVALFVKSMNYLYYASRAVKPYKEHFETHGFEHVQMDKEWMAMRDMEQTHMEHIRKHMNFEQTFTVPNDKCFETFLETQHLKELYDLHSDRTALLTLWNSQLTELIRKELQTLYVANFIIGGELLRHHIRSPYIFSIASGGSKLDDVFQHPQLENIYVPVTSKVRIVLTDKHGYDDGNEREIWWNDFWIRMNTMEVSSNELLTHITHIKQIEDVDDVSKKMILTQGPLFVTMLKKHVSKQLFEKVTVIFRRVFRLCVLSPENVSFTVPTAYFLRPKTGIYQTTMTYKDDLYCEYDEQERKYEGFKKYERLLRNDLKELRGNPHPPTHYSRTPYPTT